MPRNASALDSEGPAALLKGWGAMETCNHRDHGLFDNKPIHCDLPTGHKGAHRFIYDDAAKPCFASYDFDGMGGPDCELPAGHEGQHRTTIEWDEQPRPTGPADVSPGYGAFLANRYGVTK